MTIPRPIGAADDPASVETLAGRIAAAGGATLFVGAAGSGKSVLIARVAARLAGVRTCRCLGLDPGTPAFGVPGAACLGAWRGDRWRLQAVEPLCTLDPGRFRLPLAAAAAALAAQAGDGPLLVDPPGLVRGMAAGELLAALVALLSPTLVVVLVRDRVPLADELAASGREVVAVRAAAAARRPGSRARTRARTALWDAWLADGHDVKLAMDDRPAVGAPPPRSVATAWVGRQVALLAQGRAVAFGEVLSFDGGVMRARLCGAASGDALLVRDALRNEAGELVTAEPFVARDAAWLPPPPPAPLAPAAGGPRPVARVGAVDAMLVNGVFGDPLLHLRVRHRRRGLLFDLGDMERLPARLAHQLTDVFISHAHMDHVGGFLWLLRSRLGPAGGCRLYGPPGIARHLASLVDGVEWDRIGDAGPVFEVHELDGDRLLHYRLAVGRGLERVGRSPAPAGVMLREPGLAVRATTLDHGIPVLAFAFEPAREVRVRQDRLAASGLTPGPWLTELREAVTAGDAAKVLSLPDGSERSAADLAGELLLVAPARRLVYATDLADTADNRERLIALAADAHTLFCEAPFLERDAGQARRTGHLTARACGEIGAAARVGQLIPFHFSRRYQHDPEAVYDEVAAACPRIVRPPRDVGRETSRRPARSARAGGCGYEGDVDGRR